MDYSLPGSSVYWDSPGRNIEVGCHALLQGVFPSQGLNPGSPTLQTDSLPSEPPGKPASNSYCFCNQNDCEKMHGGEYPVSPPWFHPTARCVVVAEVLSLVLLPEQCATSHTSLGKRVPNMQGFNILPQALIEPL